VIFGFIAPSLGLILDLDYLAEGAQQEVGQRLQYCRRHLWNRQLPRLAPKVERKLCWRCVCV
jgi:hypothetical protein